MSTARKSLALILRAWVTWPGSEAGTSDDRDEIAMLYVGNVLYDAGLAYAGEPTATGEALLRELAAVEAG